MQLYIEQSYFSITAKRLESTSTIQPDLPLVKKYIVSRFFLPQFMGTRTIIVLKILREQHFAAWLTFLSSFDNDEFTFLGGNPMKYITSTLSNLRIQEVGSPAALFVLALAFTYLWPLQLGAAEGSLLEGKITSATGEALAGIPVRVNQNNITVTVYTNSLGEYAYPAWAQVKPGEGSVAVELPEYALVKQLVTLAADKTAKLDLKLTARTPSVEDATASEIVAALPGTDEQKHLLIQCANCHSLQHAFRVARDKQGWKQIIRRMAGEKRINVDSANSRTFDQKKYLEPLSEYLAMVRGPGSSSDIPFKLRPRPTDNASTRLVVTEYDVPRGGTREIILRGDERAAWPHDVLLDSEGSYIYYTDHFSNTLGRMDRRTGEMKEFPYEIDGVMGRTGEVVDLTQERAGDPGGGSLDIEWDREGNVVFGMDNGTVSFNPKTEKFKTFPFGNTKFGMDGAGNVWFATDGDYLYKLNLNTGEPTTYDTVPKALADTSYDMETDTQGRSFFNMFRHSAIGMFDPATERFEAIPILTQGSGPRRGDLDHQGRVWSGLHWAGRVNMFDPKTREMKEYSLIPGVKPYGPPFISAYTVQVDDKNQAVWTNDFNDRRTYRIDMATGQSTEYYMPLPYEVRDMTVEDNAPRPTVWIPAYRPPAKLVKIELY